MAEGRGLSTARIENLNDNVFSIVMTLLILNFKVPELPDSLARSLLPQKLLALWPDFLTYAMSFLILGIYWIGHHNQYHFIKRTDRLFLWINILFFMCVALVPFLTSLLARYLNEPIVVLIYYGSNIVTAGVFYLHWHYATQGNRLVDEIDPQVVKSTKWRILIAPASCIPLGALCFFNTKLSLLIYFLILLYYIFPVAIDRLWAVKRHEA